MFKQCGNCGYKNLLIAHFCAQCGAPFEHPDAQSKRCKNRHCKIGAGWLILLVPFCFIFLSNHGSRYLSFRRPCATETHQYSLPRSKAQALYNLLAPDRVHVLVSECGAGTCVKGTRRELDVVDRFVALLDRVGCQHSRCIQAYMKKVRSSWTTRRGYKLPYESAETFYRLLACDDVPVTVSQRKSEVRVSANEEDQNTVGRFVDILRGRRNP